MSNTVTNVFAIGISGLVLRGQLYTALNVASGGEFTPSYYERPGTNGIYAVTLTTADAFQGYCDVYANGASTQVLGTIPINPAEVENADVKTSTRGTSTLTPAQVNAEADTALADVGVTSVITGRIDAAISTRLAAASYTAPDNATIATRASQASVDAVKAKTDNLPSDPASTSALAAAHGAGSWATATGFSTPTNVSDAQTAIVAAQPSADSVVAALMNYALATGKTVKQAWLDIWATTAGDAEADDANNPTQETYKSPDGTVQVTHAQTATTRTNV